MKQISALLLIIFLALILRFYDLGSLPSGLHWDEQDTGYQALSLFQTGRDYHGTPLPIFPHSFADYRTPVFIYSAVPVVAKLGLSAFSVRLPALIWGVLGVAAMYVLASLMFRDSKLGFGASALLALSHWHLQYSKKSVETISLSTLFLIGLACFYKGLKKPVWLILSGLFFGLATAAYSPGKLFVPLILSTLYVIHYTNLRKNLKYSFFGALAFLVIFLPVFADGLWGKSGTRFRDVSVFTDPTVATTVDQKRLDSLMASGVPREVGLSPRLIDKVLLNKPAEIGGKILSQYLTTLGTDYLFLRGDPEPRHSPSPDRIGMLQTIELIPFIFGIVVILTTHNPQLLTILFWFLIAPIPSALTRDGGGHAARTFILLPALILILTLGHKFLYQKSKILYTLYIILYTVSTIFIYGYYFTLYRSESAKPFQWGFDWVMSKAVNESSNYDRVYVDGRNDTLLMAYLFYHQKDPASFQKLLPLQDEEVFPGVRALRFGNIYLLSPGTRFWTNITTGSRDLIISAADQPLLNDQIKSKQDTLVYPDTMTPAYYTFTK